MCPIVVRAIPKVVRLSMRWKKECPLWAQLPISSSLVGDPLRRPGRRHLLWHGQTGTRTADRTGTLPAMT
jgi:hypothetical protein